MSTQSIECLGCHQRNAPGTIFCSNCRRKIQRVERPLVAAPVAVAEPPRQRHWWQR